MPVFRFFRNHYTLPDDPTNLSTGFSWHQNAAAAKLAAKGKTTIAIAEEFETGDDGKALIAFLNRVASHANNG